MALARSFFSRHSLPISVPAHPLRSRQFSLLRPHSLRLDLPKLAGGSSLSRSIAPVAVVVDDGAPIRKRREDEDDRKEPEQGKKDGSGPTPTVMIRQDADRDATVVWLSFGDRFGALSDTVQALRDLGLDVAKGSTLAAGSKGSFKKTELVVTQQGGKVDDPNMLEYIRLTVIQKLLQYRPESSGRLGMGEEAFGAAPSKKSGVEHAPTAVHVQYDGPRKSLLFIETADRPGLLLQIIKIVTNVSIDVKSAEMKTEGPVAKAKFHVSYRDAALPAALSQVAVDTLRYYLCRPETEDESCWSKSGVEDVAPLHADADAEAGKMRRAKCRCSYPC